MQDNRACGRGQENGKEPDGFAPDPEQLQTEVEFYIQQIFIYGHGNKAYFRPFSGRGQGLGLRG